MMRIVPGLISVVLAVSLQLAGSVAQSQTATADVEAIVQELDRLYRSESSYSELEMEIVTPHWQRTLAMKGWSEGLKKTFIRITAPKKEEGVATLRIENEMWNYLPRTNKVIKVPPSMMMGSWMGSDFTNDDIVKEYSRFEDYDYGLVDVADADSSLICVEFVPHEDLPVVWGRIVAAVRRTDYLPIWERYYDEKNQLMRVMSYTDIQDFGGRMLPATLEIAPQNKEGHRTIVRYLKLELDVPLDSDLFTLRNLRTPR